jgi:hypothetical protein
MCKQPRDRGASEHKNQLSRALQVPNEVEIFAIHDEAQRKLRSAKGVKRGS